MSDDKVSSSNSASSIEEKTNPAFSNDMHTDSIKDVVVDPNSSYVYGPVPTKTEPRAKGGDPTTLYPDAEASLSREQLWSLTTNA